MSDHRYEHWTVIDRPESGQIDHRCEKPTVWPRGGWLRGGVAGVFYLLMPKCPACVASYIAVTTGLGISYTAAGWLRYAILTTCVILLVAFVFSLLQALRRQTGSRVPAPPVQFR